MMLWLREGATMAAIQTSKFGQIRALSAWESLQQWQQRRTAARQDFEARASIANTALATALTDQISGTGTLAAQAALKRIQEAAQKKLAQPAPAANSAPVAPPKLVGSTVTLADGLSKIDLEKGTLTMADGSVVDLKTGVKKVSVTV